MQHAEKDSVRGALEFGPFRLYTQQRTLMKYEQEVRLGSRAKDILLALVQRHGEVVKKRELIAQVWPEMVVEDATLRVHIAALRKALGDMPPHAKYVENVNGHGYRFVAPIRQSAERELESLPPAEIKPALVPAPLARMIGRDATLASLTRRVRERRLVTVTGPGGIGKTTVALAALEQLTDSFADGVHFIDLSGVADPSQVAAYIAAALGTKVDAAGAGDALVARLHFTRSLLLLDNCEHLIEPMASLLETVLTATAGVHIVATSREPLNARGESILRLPPLAAPPAQPIPTSAEAMRFAAIELFVEHAIAASHDYSLTDADAPSVAEICRRLDGLPLAIELAAAQAGLLGVRWLAAHIDDHLNLLTRGRRTAAARHRSLRASIQWSWNLLTATERAAVSTLADFHGPFSFSSAQAALASAAIDAANASDLIANLAAKSLIVAERCEGEMQLQLLASTRAYALESRAAAA